MDREFDLVLIKVRVVDFEDVFPNLVLELAQVLVVCFDFMLVDFVILEGIDLILDEEDLDEPTFT
jgi:hypothetical protein